MNTELAKCAELLRNMCQQADEDTPSEYRTEHFRMAMYEGLSFLENYDGVEPGTYATYSEDEEEQEEEQKH